MRKLLLTLACGLSGLAVFAAPLTPEAALSRVLKSGGSHKAPSMKNRPYALQFTKSIKGKEAVYVFSSGKDGGYMVVSADDLSTPLLGFSPTGILPSSESELPDGLRYWLGTLAEQVAYNAEHNNPSVIRLKEAETVREDIGPMVTTKWNQGAPYNDKCPEIDETRCVTGCVATAMAQILRYHNFPANVMDNHSYIWNNYYTLSISPDITFDWNSMLDVYDDLSTDENKDAVATLMRACGIAADMNYGIDGSGAYDHNACRAFIESFGYDKGAHLLFRDHYSSNEWNDIVYSNLKEFGPIYYSGQSNSGGHAFVCDGYSDGYYHFNWGWGGISDGYFLLSALDPTVQGIGGHQSGYNFSQSIITSLTPRQITEARDPQLTWTSNFIIMDANSYNDYSVSLLPSSNRQLTIDGSIYNKDYTSVSDYNIGVILISENQEETFIPSSSSFETLNPGYGYSHIYAVFELPWDLEEGNYTVVPAYVIGEGTPTRFKVPNNYYASYEMLVSDDKAHFTVTPIVIALLTAEDFKMQTHIIRKENVLFKGQQFKCSARITNPSETEEYHGSVNAAILTGSYSYNIAATGDKIAISLMPGESVDVEFVTSLNYLTNNQGNNMVNDSGNYNMYLLADNRFLLAGPIAFTHMPETDNAISVVNLQIENGQSPEKVMATATVNCPEGYFGGTLRLYVFSEDEAYSITAAQSDFLTVSKSNPATTKWQIDLSDADITKQYHAGVYDTAKNKWLTDGYTYFTIGTPDGVGSVTTEGPVVIGRRYMTVTGIDLGSEKPRPGIYVLHETFADGSVKTRKVAVSETSCL